MDHDHGHGGDMPGMPSMAAPPPSDMKPHHMMMHMTFFWDNKDTLILFDGWPGNSTRMYYVALLVVFLLAFICEGISLISFRKKPGRVVSGIMLTVMHTIRMGLAYLVMLALMSFNGGVFLVAVTGHCVGYLLFGSGIFLKKNSDDEEVKMHLPASHC